MIEVSRETDEQLAIFSDLLKKWNPKINLVAPSTLDCLEDRHLRDSAQLLAHAPTGWTDWVDLGSGGGFPGLVVSLMSPGRNVTLIEADKRKAAFLRAAVRETGANARIVAARIEDVSPLAAQVVSARALAPLKHLLGLVERHLAPEGTALLPKGAGVDGEIEDALETWRFDCEKIPSRTDPRAVILSIGEISRV